ncbi:response regulator [Maribellus comscasis]|uniref:histidine kinase n=1 Tax=Maribellus comscasis TaxID=2681766 RepID=A0A6I6JW14_9BACT|nr:ATP-binding protein [Maribellus comscasis]QGY45310.1 response regulator [Maribellus comscasis]
MKDRPDIERIEELIGALMKVARGDYSVQVPLSEKNDHLDALAMGFNLMVDDIGSSKKIEKENKKIKRLNKQLEEAKKAAEESNRLKSIFISNLSHEIRTPMNGIIGFANLLNEDDISTETRKNYTQIIVNSSNQLLRIIDDILEISRLETKQVKLNEQVVNINDFMIELFNIFNLKSKESKIPIYLKRALPDEFSNAYTDRLKLSKILCNLLENALKFTNSGHIEFGYVCNDAEIEFYVKDTGIGINKEKQKSIFGRFSQVDSKLSRKSGGLGLGLAIASENAALLGGEIRVTSKEGSGSTFYLSIPFKHVNKQVDDNKTGTAELNNKFKIIIAEDEEVNLLYLETLLKKINRDIHIIQASNGEEAIDLCKRNYPVDLVFMDVKLPVLNGLEATRKIKQIYPELPVIAQSAYTSAREIENAKQAGVDDYITKPIVKEELFEVLERYMYVKNND